MTKKLQDKNYNDTNMHSKKNSKKSSEDINLKNIDIQNDEIVNYFSNKQIQIEKLLKHTMIKQ
jgi:hypothetical protein